MSNTRDKTNREALKRLSDPAPESLTAPAVPAAGAYDPAEPTQTTCTASAAAVVLRSWDRSAGLNLLWTALDSLDAEIGSLSVGVDCAGQPQILMTGTAGQLRLRPGELLLTNAAGVGWRLDADGLTLVEADGATDTEGPFAPADVAGCVDGSPVTFRVLLIAP